VADVRIPGVGSRADSPAYEQSFDAALTGLVAPLTGGAALLFTALAGLHLVLGEGPAGTLMALAAAATAAGFAAGFLALRRRRLPDHLAQPLTAGVMTVLVAHAVTSMVLAGQPRQTTNLMLIVVAAGALLLSMRWMLAMLYLVWSAWLVGAFAIGPATQWPHFVVGLVGASALALLVSALRRASVRELADACAAAETAAVRDHLTGAANRRGLAMVGAQVVELARRQGDAVHCLFVDVHGLKVVNDTLGHGAGDEVLVAVADTLRAVTRATDVVARWGDAEFCVVGPGPGISPLQLEQRVRDGVLRHAPVPAEVWAGTVNAGGAMLAPWDSGSLETLLGKADQQMYLRRSLRSQRVRPLSRPSAAE
jgi:diguanylate cyclase (GGDEF)-like protein